MSEITTARLNFPRKLAPYSLVFLATFLWSTNLILGRLLSTQIGPFTLTASRFTIAGILYAGILRWESPNAFNQKLFDNLSRREWALLIIMALTGVAGFPGLLYLSLHWTTASNAALLNGTIPLATTLMAAFTLHEDLKPGHVWGSLVSLAGVILVIGGGTLEAFQSHSINPGDLLLLLDTLLWSIYSISSRLVTRGRTALAVTAISAWLGLPLLYLAALLEWLSRPLLLSPSLVIAVIYIAIFPTCIGFFAWNEGVRRLGPTLSMAFYNLLPVFGVLLSILFLGEPIAWFHLVGGLFVIGGGLWVIRGRV